MNELCCKCGTPLTEFFSGFADCSGHYREDFEEVEGYRFDATDGLGDWDNGPTYLLVPLDADKHRTSFWVSKARCCSRVDLDDGEPDWCPECGDVMEPAISKASTP